MNMPEQIKAESLLARGREALAVEAAAIEDLRLHLDETFVKVALAILDCRGKVIVTGMGKSGHIGRKFAATLSSLGTPAFYLHPGEGAHGDLGMVTAEDFVFALSNSGESRDVLALLPTLKILGCRLAAMVGNADSTLARQSDFVLTVDVRREADHLNLAPTASTVAMSALGDALAVAVAEGRRFSADDFALLHPGGALGQRLLHTVGGLMHSGAANPVIRAETLLREAIAVMSEKGLGAVSVVDAGNRLSGLITDGDLRRFLAKCEHPLDRTASEAMTPDPGTIGPEALAAEALHVMENTASGVTVLPVVADGLLVGLIHLHDILRALTGPR